MSLRRRFFNISWRRSPMVRQPALFSSFNQNIEPSGSHHRSSLLTSAVSLMWEIPKVQIGVAHPVTQQTPQSNKWLKEKLTPSWDACKAIWHDIQQLDMAQNYSKSTDIDTLHASIENLEVLVSKLQHAVTELEKQIIDLQQTFPHDRLQIHELARRWQAKITLARNLERYLQHYERVMVHDHNKQVVERFMGMETTRRPGGDEQPTPSSTLPTPRRRPLPPAEELRVCLRQLVNNEAVVDVPSPLSP
jgi:hypothetical protein